MNPIVLVPILGVAGLIAAFVIYRLVLRYSAGEGRVAEIGEDIHEAAMVFMQREYSILAIFALLLTVLLFIGFQSWHTPLAFVVGALASGSAGYIGMYTATRANMRTTEAARTLISSRSRV